MHVLYAMSSVKLTYLRRQVKVTAPRDCKVAGLTVAAGTRVVEGALILSLK